MPLTVPITVFFVSVAGNVVVCCEVAGFVEDIDIIESVDIED
jgi:hypothetical protein